MKYRILLLIWLSLLVSYFDRINLSVAMPIISKQLHLTSGEVGMILGSFFFGYTLIQIPGGFISDRFGQKKSIVASMIWWSVFTLLTGAVNTFVLFFVVRILFGIGEGVQAPAGWRVVANWFKDGERALASGVYLTSLAIGPAIVPGIVVPIMAHMGWQTVFYFSAIPGVIVAILMALWLKDSPDSATVVQNSAKRPTISAKVLWTSPSLWFAFIAFLGFGFAFYGLLTWLPTYLMKYKHFDLKHMGIYSTLPYIFGVVGLIAGGWLGDHVFKRNRKYLIATAYVITAIFLWLAFAAKTPTGAGVLISVAGLFLYMGFGPFWTIPMDIVPNEYVGTFLGFVNMGPQIAGFIAPTLIGFMVGTGSSFFGGFAVMIFGLLAGALFIMLVRPIRAESLRQEVQITAS